MITYTDSLERITVDMLRGFFVGWANKPSPETHLKLLKNSDKAVLAIDENSGKVAGFITAVSDSILCAYIPFLEVLPEYQNQGIGAELIRRMFEYYEDLYMIDLMCDKNLQKYYEKFGMIESTGMIIRNYDRRAGEDK